MVIMSWVWFHRQSPAPTAIRSFLYVSENDRLDRSYRERWRGGIGQRCGRGVFSLLDANFARERNCQDCWTALRSYHRAIGREGGPPGRFGRRRNDSECDGPAGRKD